MSAGVSTGGADGDCIDNFVAPSRLIVNGQVSSVDRWWQTVDEAKGKDRTEHKVCRLDHQWFPREHIASASTIF